MTIHNNVRIVVHFPNLLDRLESKYLTLERWQKEEIVREMFDVMELNLNSFAKSMACGVTVAHLFPNPPTIAEQSDINRLYLEIGMEFWFRCKDLNLFKMEVNEASINGFIDTFPMFLEFIGPDYVILTHNELKMHPVARPIGIV